MKPENVLDWQPENAQSSQNQRTAKKRPDIRNNSHWGIGSDKVWQDAPGKVQLREKKPPAVLGGGQRAFQEHV